MQGLPRAGAVIRTPLAHPVLVAHVIRDVLSRRWRRPSVALDSLSKSRALDTVSHLARLNARRWHAGHLGVAHTLQRSQPIQSNMPRQGRHHVARNGLNVSRHFAHMEARS